MYLYLDLYFFPNGLIIFQPETPNAIIFLLVLLMGFPPMESTNWSWITDRNRWLWWSGIIESLETHFKLFDLQCCQSGTLYFLVDSIFLSDHFSRKIDITIACIITITPDTLYYLWNQSSLNYQMSVHCKMLCDGGRNKYQRALKGSPNFQFFLITGHLCFWKWFISVIHDHVVDSMEGNLIQRTS